MALSSGLDIRREAVEEGGRPRTTQPAPAATDRRSTTKALGEAVRAAGVPIGTPRSGSETPSEEDYDQNVRPGLTGAGLRRRVRNLTPGEKRPGIVRSGSGVHIMSYDDKGTQEFLEKSSRRAGQLQVALSQRPGKFRDFVFTHQFSAFDRKNTEAINNPFHGFYTLFWMGVALFVFKISSENWRVYGNPLGTNEIMKTMFHREGRPLLPEIPWEHVC